MPHWIKYGGQWIKPSSAWIKTAGQWQPIKAGWIKANGVWSQVFPNQSPLSTIWIAGGSFSIQNYYSNGEFRGEYWTAPGSNPYNWRTVKGINNDWWFALTNNSTRIDSIGYLDSSRNFNPSVIELGKNGGLQNLEIDNDGNVYYVYTTAGTGNQRVIQRKPNGTITDNFGGLRLLKVTARDVLIGHTYDNSSSPTYQNITKYLVDRNTGNKQQIAYFYYYDDPGNNAASGLNGEVYWGAGLNNGDPRNSYIARYTPSSGFTVHWVDLGATFCRDIQTDSKGNIVVACNGGSDNTESIRIYTPDGQLKSYYDLGGVKTGGIKLDIFDNIYAYANNGTSYTVICVTNDGIIQRPLFNTSVGAVYLAIDPPEIR